MENLGNIDDLGGKPTIFGNIHVALAFQSYILRRFQFLGVSIHTSSPGLWISRDIVVKTTPQVFFWWKVETFNIVETSPTGH